MTWLRSAPQAVFNFAGALVQTVVGKSEGIRRQIESHVGTSALSGRFLRWHRRLEDDFCCTDEELGSGYSGVVLLATDRCDASRQVAVKHIELRNRCSDDVTEICSEINHLLHADHSHIVQLHCVYQESQQVYLVTEFLGGGDLHSRLVARGTFSEVDARDALQQMLLALSYLHNHGIIHRDVKLQNCVYESPKSSCLKLVDFGSSESFKLDSGKNSNPRVPTLAYAAPEIIEGRYDSQCDMWSLGVVAFALLSGELPFSSRTVDEADQIVRILNAAYCMDRSKWSTISEEAKDFVRALLVVCPSTRLSPKDAIELPWLQSLPDIGYAKLTETLEAIQVFSTFPRFLRCLVKVLTRSSAGMEYAHVRHCFLSLASNDTGTIGLPQFQKAMASELGIHDQEEVSRIFNAVTCHPTLEICYSDFVAASLSNHTQLTDQLLQAAFRWFDADEKGYLTVKEISALLADHVDSEDLDDFMQATGILPTENIDFEQFAWYLRSSIPSTKSAPLSLSNSWACELSARLEETFHQISWAIAA